MYSPKIFLFPNQFVNKLSTNIILNKHKQVRSKLIKRIIDYSVICTIL